MYKVYQINLRVNSFQYVVFFKQWIYKVIKLRKLCGFERSVRLCGFKKFEVIAILCSLVSTKELKSTYINNRTTATVYCCAAKNM